MSENSITGQPSHDSNGSGKNDPVHLIQDALAKEDGEALYYQHRRARMAVVASVLGPCAILALAMQAIFFQPGGMISIVLISIEVLALVAALLVSSLGVSHSHREWIRHRLLAEILRRESFFFCTRVGPYLRTEGEHARADVERRLLEIRRMEGEPLGLTSMEDRDGQDWRGALEDARQDGSWSHAPDLASCISRYRGDRITDQREWFNKKRTSLGKKDQRFEFGARATLTLALVLAGLHLGMLLGHSGAEHSATHRILGVVAIGLSAGLGATFVGLRTIFEYHRLSRSYGHNGEALMVLERQLLDLEHELARNPDGAEGFEFRFKRLVLRTEDLLTDDLRQWFLIISPEEPRSGA